MTETGRNWADNIAYAASRIARPQSIAELCELVRAAPKVRPLGSRHSFNRLADTDGLLVSLRGLPRVVRLDADARRVTVDGGATYGEVCPLIRAAGFALPNLASLPHISVAGAVATATHGSGTGIGNLATAVAALELVTPDGGILTLARGDPEFDGAVVGLGALGVVAAITLDLVPDFDMRQDVFLDLPFAALVDSFEAISAGAYSVSLLTGWTGETVDQVWLKSRADVPFSHAEGFFGARPAQRAWHPIAALDPRACTQQMGVVGAWHERLPHFRMEFTPSAGAELQSEYFVARTDAAAALKALRAIGDRVAPHLMISEIRTVASDSLWLSPSYEQDCLAIHFTFRPDAAAVKGLVPEIEAQLAPFRARPHWGKIFTLPAATVRDRFARRGDFARLAYRLDPGGKFRNAFLDSYVL